MAKQGDAKKASRYQARADAGSVGAPADPDVIKRIVASRVDADHALALRFQAAHMAAAKREKQARDREAAEEVLAKSAGRWVVLIYMAATSPDLREIVERDLAEMATRLRLMKPDALRVYALMDAPEGSYTVRHRLDRTPPQGPPSDPQIMRLTPELAGQIGRKGAFLADFITWRFGRDARAELKGFDKTLLVLWGHSQGVASALSKPGSPAYAMVGNGGFGFDQLSGEALSLPQIRRAIARGLKSFDDKTVIDILSFDSCFMSAAEVSAEFQRQAPPLEPLDGETAEELATRKDDDEAARVDYVVASQTAVLLDGLDYGRLVDVFIDAPEPGKVDPRTLGLRLLEQASSTTKSPESLSLLYTGVDSPYLTFSEAFRSLVGQLSQILDTTTEPPTPNTPPERPRLSRQARLLGERLADVPGANRSEWLRIRDAFEGATWHKVRQFIDLADLCRRLANNSRTDALRSAARDVLTALQPATTLPTQGLVVDVRSLHPLLLSGMSLYCPWLFPTPEEVRRGAWNAVVDLFDYADDLWFNRGAGSWGAFLYHAKHVLEEARQRAINTEIADLRAIARASGSRAVDRNADDGDPSDATPTTASNLRGNDKPGGDAFTPAEPMGFRASSQLVMSPVASGALRLGAESRAASLGHLDHQSICPKSPRN